MRRYSGSKAGVAAAKIMSRNQIFHRMSETKMHQLKTKQIKKRSFVKIKWGVQAYCEWYANRLSDVDNYDEKVFNANIECLDTLHKENFCHSICHFIPEITKVKDGSEYPGKTLYEFLLQFKGI